MQPDSQPTGVSRRGFLGGALALGLGAGALSACSSPLGAGLAGSTLDPGTVQYWNLFGGGDGVRMQAMEAGFQKSDPGIGLSSVTLAWGNPYYTKLSLATLGGEPPDVAVAHLTRMKTLQAADLLTELQPADLARHGMTADKFNQTAWKAGLVDGKIYAIPLDTHPFVCFYNTDVCKKAGLLDSSGKLKPITGEQAFMDALTKAKKVTGQYGATIAAINETSTPWRIFQSLYTQLGGAPVISSQGTEVTIDDAKALQVLNFLSKLNSTNLMPGSLDYQGAIATFAAGRAGFFFQGEWEITTFQTAKTPFSMTKFPNVYGGANNYAVQADSHTLTIPKDSGRSPQPSWTTRSRSSGRCSTRARRGRPAGTYRPGCRTGTAAAYAKLTPQSNYASAADSAAYDPIAWYSGSGSDFEIIVGGTIGAVMSGVSSPRGGLDQIKTKLTVLAKTQPPTQ